VLKSVAASTQTAKINGLKPYTWLRYILERLPHAQEGIDYEALLPWNLSPELHGKQSGGLEIGMVHGSDSVNWSGGSF